jgi:N-acetylglutamate synthase-like GNAT family acetyltransferase
VHKSTDIFDYPESRVEREEIVRFLHARLPCVPIKVIRANSLEPEARVFRMRSNDGTNQLIGAVVFKDHPDVEFREVKYFCTAYQGGGIGSRLMSALKQDAISARIFFIVLYASNTAVQFFAKQSFLNYPNSVVGLSKSVVLGRVEQYQRSTLMASDLIAEYPNSFKYLVESPEVASIRIGDPVMVSHGVRRAREEEGVITDIKNKLRVRVKYPRWTNDTEEWIVLGAKRLRVLESEELEAPVEEEHIRSKKIRII